MSSTIAFASQAWRSRLGELPAQLSEFCRRWSISEMGIFGSALTNDFRADSDVDVLITFTPDAPWSLADWVNMRDELEKLVGRKIDLVEKQAIRNPFRRKSILDTQQVIYAA